MAPLLVGQRRRLTLVAVARSGGGQGSGSPTVLLTGWLAEHGRSQARCPKSSLFLHLRTGDFACSLRPLSRFEPDSTLLNIFKYEEPSETTTK